LLAIDILNDAVAGSGRPASRQTSLRHVDCMPFVNILNI